MLRNFVPSTDKIYYWDFPKVAFLKGSTKGARINEQLLWQSALYLTFYQQKIDKYAILRNFAPSTHKIYQWDFPKVAFLKHSRKGAMSGSFRREIMWKHLWKLLKSDIQIFFRILLFSLIILQSFVFPPRH